VEYNWTGLNEKLLAACILLFWIVVGSAHSIKSCSVQAVCQVVFTDVLIVGRLDVHGQSFAPIGLHKRDAASDWLLRKRVCIGMEGMPGVQLQN
jgi:hypothetical protein